MNNSPMKYNGQLPSTSNKTEDAQRKIAAVYGIASLCSTEVNKNATKLWVSVLREYPAEIVEEATDRLIRNEEMLKMPTPAVLIRYIKEIEYERQREQSRIERERRKRFEDARKEASQRYNKRLNALYDQCFYKVINGNQYEAKCREASARYHKELDTINAEEKASMLEWSNGQD